MTPSEESVAAALEALLRQVPGVIAIYPSAPAPAVIVGTLLAPLTSGSAPSLVTVTTAAGEVTVVASIGVDDEAAAPTTGRAAHDCIVGYLASHRTHPLLPARVTVRIGMVG